VKNRTTTRWEGFKMAFAHSIYFRCTGLQPPLKAGPKEDRKKFQLFKHQQEKVTTSRNQLLDLYRKVHYRTWCLEILIIWSILTFLKIIFSMGHRSCWTHFGTLINWVTAPERLLPCSKSFMKWTLLVFLLYMPTTF
jgi:hypothetical protein